MNNIEVPYSVMQYPELYDLIHETANKWMFEFDTTENRSKMEDDFLRVIENHVSENGLCECKPCLRDRKIDGILK